MDASLAIIPFAAFGFVVGFASFAFWVWMLVDAITNEPSEGNDKLIWILVIVLTGFLGAAIYFFVRRPQRMLSIGQKPIHR